MSIATRRRCSNAIWLNIPPHLPFRMRKSCCSIPRFRNTTQWQGHHKILPGTFHWSSLKDFNRLMEPIWNSKLILSSDHFSVSNLFHLMTILLPRYLERETTMHSSLTMFAKIMLDDLKKRFSWLNNETYFQVLTCLDPGYYVIFSKPPLSARNNQMKELLATEYATWVVQSSNYNSQDMVSVLSPPLIPESLKVL